MNKLNFLTLTVYALATFRLAILLSEDSGPYKFLSKFRAMLKREEKKSPALKKSDIAHGAECLRCNGLWFAIPIASYAHFRRYFVEWFTAGCDIFLVAMALSAISILLNRIPKR